jgi:hypothetical protein
LVVFGGGPVRGGVEGLEEAFEGAAALSASGALDAGDVEEELEGFGVSGDDVDEAAALLGVAAVFVGVEVADWGAGAGARAASGHRDALLSGEGRACGSSVARAGWRWEGEVAGGEGEGRGEGRREGRGGGG